MEYVIRFAISLFDLAVFMYYFHSNKKMKPVSKVWILAGFTIAAIIWTFVSSIKNPYLNLATLLIVLMASIIHMIVVRLRKREVIDLIQLSGQQTSLILHVPFQRYSRLVQTNIC